jgi:biotin transport system substrate-specific component
VKHVAAVLIWIGVVALSARFSFPVPGSSVPQSAQTLAVLIAGVALGARMGTFALLLYLLLGGLGLPIFADGSAGWRHLLGPTSGYLVGFVVAAGMVGWLREQNRIRKLLPAFAAMIGAHLLILGLGWTRLGMTLGYETALTRGVTPFLLGGTIKSFLAAGFAAWFSRQHFSK